MSRYRMIAIDLDGTLLAPDGTVSPRAKAAVHKALKAGLLVCFATGRNFTESRMVLDAVEHYATAVFVGGAMVIDTRNRKTLHRMGMQPQLAREVCELFESLGHAALALQDTAEAGVDYLATDDVELDAATSQWMEVTAAKVKRFPRLAQHSHEHTIRVGIVASAKEIARVRKILIERFAERVICQSLFVPSYDVEVLEVFDPAVNKWEGLLQVARSHGIIPDQIVAIGDDVNDLTMIANAGLGVAMGNAKPPVLAAAKRVIGRNDQDGLAEFLEELVATHAVEPESKGELVTE
ncbi:MAG TPA: HAD family hydrolase [Tepidisphaeraceae bacterium]|nr:HAD family hydrolase [Tepidisphaeraceae bacterium]